MLNTFLMKVTQPKYALAAFAVNLQRLNGFDPAENKTGACCKFQEPC
jgi:hypothetical protein